jgi:hypothetical protein
MRRLAAIDVGEAIHLRELTAGERLPFQRDTFGSRASAATARPTNAGVSEIAKCGCTCVAVAPVRFGDAVRVEHRFRAQPSGVTATAVAQCGRSSWPSANAMRFTEAFDEIVEERDAVVVAL